jgi:threonine dehydratase
MDFYARDLAPGTQLVCASSGNFGQAVAYAARKYGLSADVFTPVDVNPAKRERIAAFGATVHAIGDEHAAAERYAAAEPGRIYVVDGKEPTIAEGAGSIGVELLDTPGIDTVVLPVGDAALISGVARWVKAHQPEIRIIGVGAAGAPNMAQSWRQGRVVVAEGAGTIAGGIDIGRPVPVAVDRIRELVDDFVLVTDDAMLDAIRLAARTLGLLLEPAGAAGLAAIATHDLPGDVIATVLTGANLDPALLPNII